jgi:hypothetical protein
LELWTDVKRAIIPQNAISNELMFVFQLNLEEFAVSSQSIHEVKKKALRFYTLEWDN